MDDFVCIHRKHEKNKEITFCTKCGIIMCESIRSIKPINYNYKLEISPLSIFDGMRVQTKNETLINNSFLSKRLSIIKNLQYITNKLKYRRQTFFLAMAYLDKIYSSLCQVKLEIKPELMALCCLIVAAKFEENDSYIPYLNDMQTLYPKQFFMNEDIKKCEVFCLQSLDYDLNILTSFHYINYFSLNGYVFIDDAIVIQTPKKGAETERRISANNYEYSSNNQNTAVTHRDSFSQRNIEKIYSRVKEILVFIIDDPIFLKYSYLHIACSCIALARNLFSLKLKWPSIIERIYNIKFEDFKECYYKVKSVFSEKNLKKGDSSLYQLKEISMIKKETHKIIDFKVINKSGYKENSNAEKNLKLNEISNNRSRDECNVEDNSKDVMSYKKKIIKKKLSFYDYPEVKVNKGSEDKTNDQVYRLKRPLNINLGISRNDNVSKEVSRKEESKGKNKNIREKKNLTNNYTQIHKKMNVSEIVCSDNNNHLNNYNNNHSFLLPINDMRNQPKSRDTSISAPKQTSVEYKELHKNRKSDVSLKKYTNPRQDNSINYLKDDPKSFNKSTIIDKVEQKATVTNSYRKGTCINLNGISILKRLSNKKSLNVDIKNLSKLDVNHKKLTSMNLSITNMPD